MSFQMIDLSGLLMLPANKTASCNRLSMRGLSAVSTADRRLQLAQPCTLQAFPHAGGSLFNERS